jgi:hypothetical protein
MRLLLSFLLCLCALFSQTGTNHVAIKQANPPDTNPRYFPVGLFSKHPQLSESRARWYASELRDLEEPSLRQGKITTGPVYRLLLIPPFTPSLVVRLTVNSDGSGKLLAKLGTKRSKDTETTQKQQTLSLSSEQVSKFLSLLREANFWSLPTEGYEESLMRGADGREWVVEANKSGNYHVVDRSDGLIEASFSRACEYLLELAPLKAETGHRTRSEINQSVPSPD